MMLRHHKSLLCHNNSRTTDGPRMHVLDTLRLCTRKAPGLQCSVNICYHTVQEDTAGWASHIKETSPPLLATAQAHDSTEHQSAVTTGTRTWIMDFEANRRGNLDERVSHYLSLSQFAHKPKAVQAKIGELKYPALNEDQVSQTRWEHRLETSHWVPHHVLSSILNPSAQKQLCLCI